MKLRLKLLPLLISISPVIADAAPSVVPATVISASPEARKIVSKVFPIGSYRKLMTGTMQQMISGMSDQIGTMPIREFAKMAGVEQSTLARLDKTTMGEIMAVLDPAYQDRSRVMMNAMLVEITNLMETQEPAIRDGLAVSYTKHFTSEQLHQLDLFFDTPAGNAYASQQMFLMTDPAVMTKIQAMMPLMMRAMPSIMGKAATATAGLPKPKTYDQLSPAERIRLAKLLGLDPGKMTK